MLCNDIVRGMEVTLEELKKIFAHDIMNVTGNLVFPQFQEAYDRRTISREQLLEILEKVRIAKTGVLEALEESGGIIDLLEETGYTFQRAINTFEYEYKNPFFPQYTICRMQADKIVEVMIWDLSPDNNIKDEIDRRQNKTNGELPLVLNNEMQVRLHPESCGLMERGIFTPDTVFNIVKFSADTERFILVEFDGEEFWVSPRQIKEVVID